MWLFKKKPIDKDRIKKEFQDRVSRKEFLVGDTVSVDVPLMVSQHSTNHYYPGIYSGEVSRQAQFDDLYSLKTVLDVRKINGVPFVRVQAFSIDFMLCDNLRARDLHCWIPAEFVTAKYEDNIYSIAKCLLGDEE